MLEEMLQDQPVDYRVMYVDMNAFFASVEQQEDKELRGKPIAVVPYKHSRATIIAASYEAKALGVHTGMLLPQATALCPEIIAVRDQPALYRDYHKRIMALLDQFYCVVGVKSIDEAYMIIPSYARTRQQVIALSQAIKASLQTEVGEYTKCSIGIGPNIWLSKMASGLRKPDGLSIITLDSLYQFYSSSKLTDFTGIARRMARQLYALGIGSASEFYDQPLPVLRSHLGIVGFKWYLRMRGYEVDMETYAQQKTMSHQTTVSGNHYLDSVTAGIYVRKLADKVASRLRGQSLWARYLSLYISFDDRTSWQGRIDLGGYVSDTATITNQVICLLSQSSFLGKGIRLFSLTALGLTIQYQLRLNLDQSNDSARRLAESIDSIRARYGVTAIGTARLLASEVVPDRVGFGRPSLL